MAACEARMGRCMDTTTPKMLAQHAKRAKKGTHSASSEAPTKPHLSISVGHPELHALQIGLLHPVDCIGATAAHTDHLCSCGCAAATGRWRGVECARQDHTRTLSSNLHMRLQDQHKSFTHLDGSLVEARRGGTRANVASSAGREPQLVAVRRLHAAYDRGTRTTNTLGSESHPAAYPGCPGTGESWDRA